MDAVEQRTPAFLCTVKPGDDRMYSMFIPRSRTISFTTCSDSSVSLESTTRIESGIGIQTATASRHRLRSVERLRVQTMSSSATLLIHRSPLVPIQTFHTYRITPK